MRSPIYLAVASAAAANAGTAVGAGGGVEAVHLVTMPMLDVPIVEADRADGRLRLKLVLRAADEIAAERLRQAMPGLRETSLATASEFARLYATPFAAVDAQRLASDMAAALRARDPAVEAVLLVEISAVRA